MDKNTIQIIRDKAKELDEMRDALEEILFKFCQNNNINYYELLGLLDVIKNDIHLATNEVDE